MTERKILLIGVLAVVVFTLAGLFYIDIKTDNEIFNETIIGMIIGGVFGWVGAYVAFYTTMNDSDNGNGNGQTSPNKEA